MTEAPTSVAEMIAKLPEIPGVKPTADIDTLDLDSLMRLECQALRARLALAERVIGEYVAAIDALRKGNMALLEMRPVSDATAHTLHNNHHDALANLRLALPALST